MTAAALTSSIPLGIALGLALGKPIGVFSFAFTAIKLGLGTRPEGASWVQLFGAAILAGVGFTMSLFIGMLAFPAPADAAGIRIGVLAGSLLSVAAGFLVLVLAGPELRDQRARR